MTGTSGFQKICVILFLNSGEVGYCPFPRAFILLFKKIFMSTSVSVYMYTYISSFALAIVRCDKI